MLFQLLKIQCGFDIAAHIDLVGDLGDADFVQVDLVKDQDISSWMHDLAAVRVGFVLMVKLENSAGFPFALQNLALLYVVVIEVRLVAEELERVAPEFYFAPHRLTL